eukprot:2884242-Rhodomonas_salina.3
MAFGCVIFLLLGGDTTWKIVAAFDRTGSSVSFVGTEHDNALILSQCSSQRVHPGAAPLRLRGGKPRGWRGMKRYRKNLLPVPSNREWRRQQLEWYASKCPLLSVLGQARCNRSGGIVIAADLLSGSSKGVTTTTTTTTQ